MVRSKVTLDEVVEAVGGAIHSGQVGAVFGHNTIGAYAAWQFAAQQALAMSFGEDSAFAPSELYRTAGTLEELRAFGDVLAT